MKRFLQSAVLLLAAQLFTIGTAVGDETYPSKPIVLSLQAAPGGGSDLMARQLAEALQSKNITLVIENRPGGSGYVNMSHVSSQRADGYTLSLATSSLISSRYLANLPLSFEDFKPVARVLTEEYVIVARSDSGWKTIQDVIDAMKKEPGSVKLGGGMIGSKDSMIAFELFRILGQKPAYVPFESGGEINVALLGDQLKVAVVNPLEAMPQIQSGDITVLAVASDKRSPFFPNIPTLREAGFDVIGQQWRGIWAPKETPDDIVNRAAKMFETAVKEEGFQNFMKKGMLAEAFLGPEEFQLAMQKEDAAVAKAIDELGLRGSEAK